MKHILIGDVHGCYEQLVALLKKIEWNKDEDKLIFLGDYTDRGPDSYKVYCLLKELKDDMGERCTLIFGNHEVFATESINYRRWDDKRLWMISGSSATLDSFETGVDEKTSQERLEEYSAFVEKNTILLYECDDFFACHAGLTNEDPKSLVNYHPDQLLWDRDAFENGLYNGKLCFIGHTPLKQPVLTVTVAMCPKYVTYDIGKTYPLPKRGLLDIDTCCFNTGKLTAAIVENNTVTFVQND